MSVTNTFATADGIFQTLDVTTLSSATYTYYVRCEDTSGNDNTDDYLISFAVAQVPSGDGLVLHYDFQNDFTTGMLTDVSGTGNNATCQENGFYVNNDPATTKIQVDQCPAVAAGPNSNAARAAAFNGSVCRLNSDYFAVAKSTSLTSLSSGTVSVWVYLNPSTDPNFQIPYTSPDAQQIFDSDGSGEEDIPGAWILKRV